MPTGYSEEVLEKVMWSKQKLPEKNLPLRKNIFLSKCLRFLENCRNSKVSKVNPTYLQMFL